MADEIRFCPNCGSVEVEPDTTNSAEVAAAGGNTNRWLCNECGYIGLMPEGDPDEDFDRDFEENVEFEPSENVEKVDTGFGQGYLRYLAYITLPLLLALLLLYLLQP